MTWTGLVLAGGRSERFGERDKALVEIDETPMLARVVDRVRGVTDDVVVSCREDQRDSFCDVVPDVRFAVDPVPDEGPLVGLSAALSPVSTSGVVVVACDMPGVDPSFLELLCERTAGKDGAVPTLRDGRRQPVQAAYRVAPLREASEATLADGDRRLLSAVDRLDVTVVSPSTVAAHTSWETLTNVNTPAELAAFAEAN